MTRIARLVLLALSLAILLPGAAHAAAVREYQIQYAPAGDVSQSLLIVTAILDPAESLPASVTVPVPAGATLLWSGELLGGSPDADPFRQTTKTTVGTMDLYTFTVEESGLGQLEVSLGAPTISGNRVSGAMTWTNPGDEVLVSASLVAEAGATDVKTTPAVAGAVQQNSVGETLHPLGSVRLTQNGSYVIEASWRRGGGSASDSPLLPILLGALAVALLALVVVIARERTRARRAPSSGDA
jgi:hypothetical protein